jgi:hypothetical protein
MHELPMPETPKRRKDLRRRSERSLTVGLPWNGRGHMGVHHVPVSREDKREWWDPMMSPKVTWTLLNVPCATGVGDSCAVGPGEERLEVRESGVEEGSEGENLRGPKTPKPETPKFEILKFSKDIRTVEDLTVGSSWTKTPKTEVPKICRAKQGSENLVNLKRFLIHVG